MKFLNLVVKIGSLCCCCLLVLQ